MRFTWKRQSLPIAAALILTLTPQSDASAQTTITADSAIRRRASIIGGPAAVEARRALSKAWNELVSDPALLNRGLEALLEGGRLRLLSNLNLRFAMFETEDSDQRGLGLEYSFAHDLLRSTFRQQLASEVGFALSLSSTGNVAFNREINPRDFVSLNGAVRVFGSHGGVAEARQTSPEVQTRLNILQAEMARIETLADLLESSATREYLSIMREALTNHVYWDLSGSVRFESDQSLEQMQTVYALVAAAVMTTPDAASWNVFDWPFALIRWLTNSDQSFMPRATFPSVQFEIASVAPDDVEPRVLLGETGSYPRFRFEAGFRTPLFIKHNGDRYFADIAYRSYKELSAPSTIEAAGLDHFEYLAAALVSPAGPFVSYSRGQLPFDKQSEAVYGLGFRYDF